MNRKRLSVIAAMVLGASALSAASLISGHPRVIYNASASVPLGFYVVTPDKALRRGDLVLVHTPAQVRDLADRRHYLPRTVPMLKHVAALNGDVVCASGTMIFINGNWRAERESLDHLGRELPTWQGCRTLGAKDLFLLNPDVRDSFDGRYFGVVDRGLGIGKVRRL